MIDIYKEAVSQAWKKNISQVRGLLIANDKRLLYKIQSASQRWNIPVSEIKESIANNKVAAAHFTVDPNKQKNSGRIYPLPTRLKRVTIKN